MSTCHREFDQCLKTIPDIPPAIPVDMISSFFYYFKKRQYDQNLLNQQKAGYIINKSMTSNKCYHVYDTCLHIERKRSSLGLISK
jgi:hypothetical protein